MLQPRSDLCALWIQAVENLDGGGANWGLVQMPFSDYRPGNGPWPEVPIRFSKQYYAMMQVSKYPLEISSLTALL